MKTLEKIKAAAKMGYSATIKDSSGLIMRVVSVETGHLITIKEDGWNSFIGTPFGEEVKITGYLYVGHLFGEPEIPEGQRFRVKDNGEVFECSGVGTFGRLYSKSGSRHLKSELEPYFND